MTNDRRSELRAALQGHVDSGDLPGAEFQRLWDLVSEILEGQTVELFYAAPLAPGTYDGFPRPALQVVVCSPTLAYDCLFSGSTMRYDVSFLAGIYRLEEQWSREESVDGPSRAKLSVIIEFENYRGGLVLQFIAYGDKAAELHAFARGVYALSMAKGK